MVIPANLIRGKPGRKDEEKKKKKKKKKDVGNEAWLGGFLCENELRA